MFKHGGAVEVSWLRKTQTFSTIADSERDANPCICASRIPDALRVISMSGKFTPETRSNIVCLGDALTDQVPPSRGTKISCFQNLYR